MGKGRDIFAKHGFDDAGIRTDALDLFSDCCPLIFKDAALVWLNDKGWPLDNVGRALRLAAEQLGSGAAVVSYGSEAVEPPPGLRLAETLSVPTSWCAAEKIRIFVRIP